MSETSPQETKRNVKVTYIISAIAISCLMIGASMGIIISGTTPSVPSVIEPGSMVGDAQYIVFNDGTSYYAKNGTTGAISYSGLNATTVTASAISALTTGRTWNEKVKLKGTFDIHASIQVPSYTTLDLEGAKLSLDTGVVTPIITNSNPTTGNVNITITGGELYGNQPTQIGSGGSGIQFTRVTNGRISDVKIFRADLDGIFLERCERTIVDRCQIEDCGEGILLSTACLDNVVSHNLIKNLMEQDGLEVSGITVQSARNSFVDNVVIGPTPGNTGIDVFQNSVDTLVEGNYFTNTGGLSVGGASSVGSDGTIVRGNLVTDTTGLATYGIKIEKATNCIVEGNTIRNMNGTGILLTAQSDRCIVSDNLIENVGKLAGGAAGINVAGGTNHSVIGNYVHDTGQACLGLVGTDCIINGNILSTPGAVSPYGLNLNGLRNIVTANRCEGGDRGMLIYGYGNLVEGNDVRNNSLSAKIQTDGYSTIRYNLGYSTEISGNQSITGAVNVVTFAHGLVSTPTLILVTPVTNGVGDYYAITNGTVYISIYFANQPGGSTWYFQWYARTW